MFSIFFFSDFHCLGELPPAQGRHTDREHRGGFQKWVEAHALAGGHLRRDPAKAR
jgi:hypothetical protein